MGRRTDRARTPGLWIAANELPTTGGHPFYQRLNQVLDAHGFDAFVESQCAPVYADGVGRPSLTPGTYFRLLLIGYFEGIDSERGIAWRPADSLALRSFLGLGLDEVPPEHSTISRTRRLIAVETHRAVFTWIVQVLATAQLVKGKTIGIDATTLEANAALRSIVRRDSGETYQAFLTQLAQASGVETPTRAALARLDRKRPKKGRNREWRHPHDPEARITKMKDGRTHLAHKAEHAVDLDTGAIVGVTAQGADQGDTTTIAETLTTAAEDLEAAAAVTDDETRVIDEVVADKGYHSNQVLVDLAALDLRTYIAEPATATPPQRVPGTAERASLRDRRDASHPPAGPRQHPEAAARPRRRVQPGPPHADRLRSGYAAKPAGAAGSAARGCGGTLGRPPRPLEPTRHAVRRSRGHVHPVSPSRTVTRRGVSMRSLTTGRLGLGGSLGFSPPRTSCLEGDGAPQSKSNSPVFNPLVISPRFRPPRVPRLRPRRVRRSRRAAARGGRLPPLARAG